MALNQNWGAFNRLVEEELRTNFERSVASHTFMDAGAEKHWRHFVYTRIREKKYKYVGLTRSAAMACANALNLLYTRKIHPWKAYNEDDPYWSMTVPTVAADLEIVKAGQAVPVHVAGDSWSVDVSVNETVSIPWRQLVVASTWDDPGPAWVEFENDPTIRTDAFIGYHQREGHFDFDYDEAEVGYGSPF